MRTLRVKLNIVDRETQPEACRIFDELSETHADQAIFQVNETRYVDERTWGFRITYRTRSEFVQARSLERAELAMSRVAPASFEKRVVTG